MSFDPREWLARTPSPTALPESIAIAAADAQAEAIVVSVRRHAQSRRMRLIVDDAGPRVTAPMRASARSIERFVTENRRWILRQVVRHATPQRAALIAGIDDVLPLRGVPTSLRWTERAIPRVMVDDAGAIEVGVPLAAASPAALAARAMRTWLVAEATRDIAQANDRAQSLLGARATRVSVRPLRTLWGSMSVDASMRIDLSLLLAPPALLDYVVMHEVCHLFERNHGARFWQRVARVHPDYPEHRRWLRQHGPSLKADLARVLGAR